MPSPRLCRIKISSMEHRSRAFLTCYNARHNRGQKRGFGALVHAGQRAEQQPVLGHGVDYTWHRKHGAQQTAGWETVTWLGLC